MMLPTNYGKKYRADFVNVFSTISKKYPLKYIPFLLKGVGGIKELNIADGIHPNNKGHEVIAKTIATVLEPEL